MQVYTGNGKGKTTAALGLALRALGSGQGVCLIQFMKKGDFGEIKALKKFKKARVCQFGRETFVSSKKPKKKDIAAAKKALNFARQVLISGKEELVILDEINVAVYFGLIKIDQVLNLIKKKSPAIELVLTGRYAHAKIIKEADLVTEMKEKKHYFWKGQKARKGIEY